MFGSDRRFRRNGVGDEHGFADQARHQLSGTHVSVVEGVRLGKTQLENARDPALMVNRRGDQRLDSTIAGDARSGRGHRRSVHVLDELAFEQAFCGYGRLGRNGGQRIARRSARDRSVGKPTCFHNSHCNAGGSRHPLRLLRNQRQSGGEVQLSGLNQVMGFDDGRERSVQV